MKKLMIVAAVAASMTAFGEDWFAENAGNLSANWSPAAPAVEDSKLVIADSDEGTTYTPTAVNGDLATSSIEFKNVVFQAAQDELPATDGAKAGITIYDGKFYVIAGGEWVATTVAADPAETYTITCDFDYANGKVEYKNGGATIYADAATGAFESINFKGDAELTALTGVYELAVVIKPVEPGEEDETPYESKEAAEKAAEAIEIGVPQAVIDAGVDQSKYKALFVKSVVEKDGKYYVKVELDPEVVEEIEGEIEAAQAIVLANPGEATKLEVKPGLYYQVKAEQTLKSLLGVADKLEMATGATVDIPPISGDSGFYQFRVDVKKDVK